MKQNLAVINSITTIRFSLMKVVLAMAYVKVFVHVNLIKSGNKLDSNVNGMHSKYLLHTPASNTKYHYEVRASLSA